ncbi:hypothetical protein BH23ACI1_BH23ACI1_01310 [soil metagenome]
MTASDILMGPVFARATGVFEALTRPAVGVVRRVDTALGRLWSRRRILVDARTPMNLAVLSPVWEVMRDDARLDVRFTGPARPDLANAFAAAGIAGRVVPRERTRLQRWDLYMNADPWEPATLWRCRHRVNFFHGVAGKYNLECPSDLPLDFERYDRVAFPNAGRMQRYVEAGLVRPDRAALIGFPKLDRLVNARVQPREAAAHLGLPPDRPAAIYAPTFSPQASLQGHGEAIVSHLLAGGFNVIIKLHDRSLDPDPRYSGGHDWRGRLAPFVAGGRCVLASRGDSTEYLLAADVLVTDHSTIGFEFCALDRPVVVFDMPELIAAARVDAGKVRLLRSASTVVSDPADVPIAAAAAMAAPDTHRAERAAAVREVFHDPGRATARAIALCYELLDFPAEFVGERLGAVSG